MRDIVDDLSFTITQVMESFPDVKPLESPFPEVKKDDPTTWPDYTELKDQTDDGKPNA